MNRRKLLSLIPGLALAPLLGKVKETQSNPPRFYEFKLGDLPLTISEINGIRSSGDFLIITFKPIYINERAFDPNKEYMTINGVRAKHGWGWTKRFNEHPDMIHPNVWLEVD